MDVFAFPYVQDDARKVCEICGDDHELRALPGPDPRLEICRGCCAEEAPELNFDKLEIAQRAKT